MKIYLDFDGTMVEHYFPEIGALNPNSIPVLAKLQSAGHEIILNTYRADIDMKYVQEALDFIHSFEGIKTIHTFLSKKIEPNSFDLLKAIDSNQLYLDDISEGTPMRRNIVLEQGMMVDWIEVEALLKNAKII